MITRHALPLLALVAAAATASNSTKRGLVFVPDPHHPDDNNLWPPPNTDLTWYYNYGADPSPAFSSASQSSFEFVPMMWGVDSGHLNATTFLDSVNGLLRSGVKVEHVLAFNEPDAASQYGGSAIDPEDAAQAWVANFEPLAKKGIKLGLPACTGAPTGIPWVKQFLGNCSNIISRGQKEKRNCTWDFLPLHWYDNFEGLASHIGEARATWPNASIWITEYAYAHQDLSASQDYFNRTLDYFDRLDYIGRYSYFGAFRSDKSNVGPNAAFLNGDGKLTDIGSWYIGGAATGVKPGGSSAGERQQVGGLLLAGVVSLAVMTVM